MASRAIAFQARPCGCRRVGAGDRHDGVDLIRKLDRPLQRLHATERATRHRGEPVDAEHVQERTLHTDHVGDRDDRKIRPVWLAGRRVDRRRAGGAAATAEQIRGDDEEPIGVERLAGSDHPVPPAETLAGRTVAIFGRETVAGAGRRRCLREARRMRVAAQRVADQDDVVTLRRQGAVGLVRDANRMQFATAIEPDRLGQIEILCFDGADRAGRKLRGEDVEAGGMARSIASLRRPASVMSSIPIGNMANLIERRDVT